MFPSIHTQDYLLLRIEAGDQQFIFEGLSDPKVIPFYGVQYSTYESTAAQMDFYNDIWRNKTGIWWKIVHKQTGERVGACGMNGYVATHEKAEIGYWLLPKFWGKGIMMEVLPVMIRFLFDNWKVHRLEAVVETGNDASAKLAEKLGFRYEGIMRECEIKQGKRVSLMLYSLLKHEANLK